jgi:hypothetical protein
LKRWTGHRVADADRVLPVVVFDRDPVRPRLGSAMRRHAGRQLEKPRFLQQPRKFPAIGLPERTHFNNDRWVRTLQEQHAARLQLYTHDALPTLGNVQKQPTEHEWDV